MKRLIASMVAGLSIALIFAIVPFESECREINNNVFRVHIMANSDSEDDQNLKLSVRDALICKAEPLLKNVKNKEEAISVVSENLRYLEDTAKAATLEAEAIVERAKKNAELEMKKAQSEIKTQIVDVSVALSEKLIEREIKEEDHHKLIDSFIAQIGDGDEE